MQTREWTQNRDKSGWGDGPWRLEPDKRQWEDPETGLPCLIVRGPVGALCGYVGVFPSHPAYGLSYDGTPKKDFERRLKRFNVAAKLHSKGAGLFESMDKAYEGLPKEDPVVCDLSEISVHGGLTYADKCAGDVCHVPDEGEPDDTWWFGFDSAHAGDFCPGMAATLRGMGTMTGSLAKYWDVRPDVYRDMGYVEKECTDLARQLSKLAESKQIEGPKE